MYSFPQQQRISVFPQVRLILLVVMAFVVLLVGSLLYFLALPSWQLRLSGVQTQAIAHEDSLCDSGDDSSADSYAFSYSFTDTHGHAQRVAVDSFCTNIYNDGDQVTVWYMPDNPTNLLTSGEAIMLYIFSGIGAVVLLVCSLIFLRVLFQPLFRRSRNTVWTNQMNGLNRY